MLLPLTQPAEPRQLIIPFPQKDAEKSAFLPKTGSQSGAHVARLMPFLSHVPLIHPSVCSQSCAPAPPECHHSLGELPHRPPGSREGCVGTERCLHRAGWHSVCHPSILRQAVPPLSLPWINKQGTKGHGSRNVSPRGAEQHTEILQLNMLGKMSQGNVINMIA